MNIDEGIKKCSKYRTWKMKKKRRNIEKNGYLSDYDKWKGKFKLKYYIFYDCIYQSGIMF